MHMIEEVSVIQDSVERENWSNYFSRDGEYLVGMLDILRWISRRLIRGREFPKFVKVKKITFQSPLIP